MVLRNRMQGQSLVTTILNMGHRAVLTSTPIVNLCFFKQRVLPYWRVSIINFPVTKRTKNNVHLFLQYQTLSPYSTHKISKYLPLQRAKVHVCTQSRALLGPHPLNARRRMTFAVNLVFKPHHLAHRGTDILRVWCRWGVRVCRVALTWYRLDIGCTSPLTRLADRTEAHCG